MKRLPQIVLDTNVLVAGLRSRNGASFQLLSRLTFSQFGLHLTVPLAMEYEDVLHRPGLLSLPVAAIDAVLDMVCAVAHQQDVHFLFHHDSSTEFRWTTPKPDTAGLSIT